VKRSPDAGTLTPKKPGAFPTSAAKKVEGERSLRSQKGEGKDEHKERAGAMYQKRELMY